jgi:hypothetical protein
MQGMAGYASACFAFNKAQIIHNSGIGCIKWSFSRDPSRLFTAISNLIIFFI